MCRKSIKLAHSIPKFGTEILFIAERLFTLVNDVAFEYDLRSCLKTFPQSEIQIHSVYSDSFQHYLNIYRTRSTIPKHFVQSLL